MFRSRLSREEAINVMNARMPAFSEPTGLLRKYYVEAEEPDTYPGICCRESKDAMDPHLKMPSKEGIAGDCKADGEARSEIMSVLARLRPE